MPKSKKVSANKRNTDRQPEIAMWPSKAEVLLPQYDRYHFNSNGKSGVFDHAQREETDRRRLCRRPTTGNSNIDVLGANTAIVGT